MSYHGYPPQPFDGKTPNRNSRTAWPMKNGHTEAHPDNKWPGKTKFYKNPPDNHDKPYRGPKKPPTPPASSPASSGMTLPMPKREETPIKLGLMK